MRTSLEHAQHPTAAIGGTPTPCTLIALKTVRSSTPSSPPPLLCLQREHILAVSEIRALGADRVTLGALVSSKGLQRVLSSSLVASGQNLTSARSHRGNRTSERRLWRLAPLSNERHERDMCSRTIPIPNPATRSPMFRAAPINIKSNRSPVDLAAQDWSRTSVW